MDTDSPWEFCKSHCPSPGRTRVPSPRLGGGSKPLLESTCLNTFLACAVNTKAYLFLIQSPCLVSQHP